MKADRPPPVIPLHATSLYTILLWVRRVNPIFLKTSHDHREVTTYRNRLREAGNLCAIETWGAIHCAFEFRKGDNLMTAAITDQSRMPWVIALLPI
ncbi:hypothetical protein VNO77_44586 [Canavalia gladiata]|uniref:Uncharacterized protein n=1 Tax=Canavalia gladiata TaxID=3824 RepID=A0AAN9PNX0_CANGL